ncbi:MAG: peptidoglycan-binding protein [Acidobacteria bacterium SCN 69-37]|nr:MAG: peptidoglycan-binding protein [Acidobacteria bacterium SCN 69-37]
MDRFEQLKQKYAAALSTITATGVSLSNLHVQDDKLFIKGRAPSEQAKNEVWTAIKQIDPTYADLHADLTIDSSLPTPPRAQAYTVKSGDTLSKIAKEFYGDATKYPKIFEANRDQLSDPDKIKVGQVLQIPPA